LGGSPQSEQAYELFYQDKWRKIPALTITRGMPNSIANMIAIECGLQGRNLTISNACNSSAEAIGTAFEQIQLGKLPIAVCGGSESMLWESIMSAWCKLRVMSTHNEQPEQACRPFSLDRDGMVMADGAGIIVLEDYDFAMARGAQPIAEIIGFASSCDAHHITAPSVEGQARAVKGALDDAQVCPSDVQYINAHGTATKLNDLAETQTIKQVFGEHAYDLSISSIKSMLGHAIGASGVLEIISTALTLKENKIPPTINLMHPDPECDLDYVPNQSCEKTVDVAVSNHFAFGGANCALVLRAL
jgi:3-oxoacyl-[acyl-carrier-protein] synthase II